LAGHEVRVSIIDIVKLVYKLVYMKSKELGLFETKTHLSEIIRQVELGQSFIITRRGRVVAELRPANQDKPRMVAGSLANPGFSMADDFDALPDEMKEYT